MISDDEAGHQVSYWPSISDLFMTLFIIAIALVVLLVSLVNLAEPPWKGQIKELRELLGMESPPSENAQRYQDELEETIRWAIAELKACAQLRQDGHDLANCLAENRRRAEENRELASLREQRAALLSLLMAVMARPPADAGGPEHDPAALARKVAALRAQLAASEQRRKALEEEIARRHDKPPIIPIGSDVLFASGVATVNQDASARLKEREFQQIADEIRARNANGLQRVDTLEIIGHTDSLPMKAARGNLDAGLPSVLAGAASMETLRPGSNNDLGLLRALAIKRAWQQFVAEQPDSAALRPIQVRTYSAGQTVPFDPAGSMTRARAASNCA